MNSKSKRQSLVQYTDRVPYYYCLHCKGCGSNRTYSRKGFTDHIKRSHIDIYESRMADGGFKKTIHIDFIPSQVAKNSVIFSLPLKKDSATT